MLPEIEKLKSDINGVNLQIENASQQELKVQNDNRTLSLEIEQLKGNISLLNSNIEDGRNEIQRISSDIDALNKTIEGVAILQQTITKGPENLRDFLIRIQDEEGLASTKCQSLEFNYSAWINCNVNEKVNEYFAGYDQVIQQDIIAPLQTLDGRSELVANFSALQTELDNLHNIFNEKYRQNQEFWVTFGGKADFFGSLNSEVGQLWNQHGQDITNHEIRLKHDASAKEANLKELENREQELENNLSIKEANLIALQKELAGLHSHLISLSSNLNDLSSKNQTLNNQLISFQNTERDLTERWKEIQSPFGSVPIELKELIALFPLSLAVGFLICSLLIRDAIRLRRIIHYLYQTKHSSGSVGSDLKIAYIAPLWIDPSNPEKNNLLRFVILSVPLIIFVASMIMIFYSWSFIDNASPTPLSQVEKLIYGGLYGVSIGFFVYGYLVIKKEIDYYSSKLPKNFKFLVNRVIELAIRDLVSNRKISLEQADSLLQKLSNYKKFYDSRDFLQANECIDHFIEEVKQLGEMLKLKEKLKILIEEANRLKIDYPYTREKA